MGKGFSGGSDSKESACNEGDAGLITGSGRSPREGHELTPVFLPGESHGQRSLTGCSQAACERAKPLVPRAESLRGLLFIQVRINSKAEMYASVNKRLSSLTCPCTL